MYGNGRSIIASLRMRTKALVSEGIFVVCEYCSQALTLWLPVLKAGVLDLGFSIIIIIMALLQHRTDPTVVTHTKLSYWRTHTRTGLTPRASFLRHIMVCHT